MNRSQVLSILCATLLVACAAKKPEHMSGPRRVMPEGATAPLFNDLGDYGYAVSTSSPQAQRYFDQGLMLTYGFNHAEAARSFREAQRLDPNCAMCFWGESYVLGMNINKPMEPSDAPRAHETAQEGLRVSQLHATQKERDLVAALTTRYTGDPAEVRAALDAAYAKAMRGFMPPKNVREFPFLEEFMPIELQTQARFGRWDEILAADSFESDFRYAAANRHYARGLALPAKGDIAAAKREQAQLDAIATGEDMKKLEMVSVGSSGADLLAVAAAILDGEIASAAGEHPKAIASLERAAQLQDELTYSEPPPWYLPVRDSLGRAQLRAGQPAQAERTYREQLRLTPSSGWTLHGLAESLRVQGKTAPAEVVEEQFQQNWTHADVTLPGSVF